MTDKEFKKMKAFVLQKDGKYFKGGRCFEWTRNLNDALRFLKREKAQDVIQKYGCLEKAIIVDCIIKYKDNGTSTVIEKMI